MLTFITASPVLADQDDFGKNNGVSFFYGDDERDLSLATDYDRARVSNKSFGVEAVFNKAGIPFGIMVVNRSTRISLYGMDGSETLESSLSTRGSGFYEYEGGIELNTTTIPLSDFWKKAEVPAVKDSKKTEITTPSGSINACAKIEKAYRDGVKDYLAEHAQEHSYRIPTHFETISSELERFNDQIDIESFYRAVENRINDLYDMIDPEDAQRFLNEFYTQIVGMSIEHRELARQQLSTWKERLSTSQQKARFKAALELDYDLSVGAGRWEVTVENIENAFYLAFPFDLNDKKTKKLVIKTGLARITNKAEFLVYKIVGKARGRIKMDADLDIEVNGANVFQDSASYQIDGSVEVPFDLGKNPLYLRSPDKEYTLVLAGIGYYNKDRTEFMAEIGWRKSRQREDRIERFKLNFSQRIAPWIAAGFSFNWRQLAPHTYFTERNIKEDILDQKEVDQFNEDVKKGRDYFGEGSLGLFVQIGKNTDVKLGEIELLGPNLWLRSALWTNITSTWRCGIGWEQYRLLLPEGQRQEIPLDDIVVDTPFEDWREHLSDDIQIESYNNFKDPRIVEDRYSVGLGYDNRKTGIESSLEFTHGDLRALRTHCKLRGIRPPLFNLSIDIEAGGRLDFKYETNKAKIVSAWFRITPRF